VVDTGVALTGIKSAAPQACRVKPIKIRLFSLSKIDAEKQHIGQAGSQ
jgi:hypothetical protein